MHNKSLFKMEITISTLYLKITDISVNDFIFACSLGQVVPIVKEELEKICRRHNTDIYTLIDSSMNGMSKYSIVIIPCEQQISASEQRYYYKILFTPDMTPHFQRYEIIPKETESAQHELSCRAITVRREPSDYSILMQIHNSGKDPELLTKFHIGDKVKYLFGNGIFEIASGFSGNDVKDIGSMYIIHSLLYKGYVVLAHESELKLVEEEEKLN